MNKEENIAELIKVCNDIVKLNHHWKVPDIPTIYKKPMKHLEQILDKVNDYDKP